MRGGVAEAAEKLGGEDAGGEQRGAQQRGAGGFHHSFQFNRAGAGAAMRLRHDEAGDAHLGKLRPQVRVVAAGGFHAAPHVGFGAFCRQQPGQCVVQCRAFLGRQDGHAVFSSMNGQFPQQICRAIPPTASAGGYIGKVIEPMACEIDRLRHHAEADRFGIGRLVMGNVPGPLPTTLWLRITSNFIPRVWLARAKLTQTLVSLRIAARFAAG